MTTRPEGERFQEQGETRVSLGGGRSIPESHYDWWRNPTSTPTATTSPAPPDPGFQQGGTGPWFRVGMGVAGVVILAVVFAGVTGWQGRHEVTVVTPDPVASAAAAVTWSHYLPGFREQLAGDSCGDLNEAFRAAQLVDGPVDSGPVEAYIAALAAAKGCTP